MLPNTDDYFGLCFCGSEFEVVHVLLQYCELVPKFFLLKHLGPWTLSHIATRSLTVKENLNLKIYDLFLEVTVSTLFCS